MWHPRLGKVFPQKYRIQPEKSKEQFALYFETYLKPEFRAFLMEQGLGGTASQSSQDSSSLSRGLSLSGQQDILRDERGDADSQSTVMGLRVELETALKEAGQLRKALNDATVQCTKQSQWTDMPTTDPFTGT